MIFNYYFSVEEGVWKEWKDKVDAFEYDDEELFDAIIVPTTETIK